MRDVESNTADRAARALDTGETLTLTALRVLVGFLFIAHGLQKLMDPAAAAQGFAAMGVPSPETSVYLALIAELAGGLGLLFGALTRVAALGPICTMIAAIAFVHAGNGIFVQQGGWELALLLLVACAYFVARGGGPISVDHAVKRARDRRHVETRRAPPSSAGGYASPA